MANDRDRFNAALSDAANSAQSILPTAAHVERTLETLLSDAVRLTDAAERLVAALKRMQPDADAG